MVQWPKAAAPEKIPTPELTERQLWKSVMNIKSLGAVATLMICAGVICRAQAADDADVFVTANNKWSFEVVPYAWLPGLKGELSVANRSVGIDQSFGDIFNSVKIAADALGIARYNNWLIYTQLDFMSLSTDKLENPPAAGNLGSKQFFYLGAAGYRFNGWSSGQTFDVLAGAQGLNIDNTLTLYQLGQVSRTRSVVDGVVMLRPSFQFTRHWLFNPTISAGVGNDNDTYQLQPQFQYQFNATWEIRFGYRKFHYKFTGDRSNMLDLNLAGPLIGFGATFK